MGKPMNMPWTLPLFVAVVGLTTTSMAAEPTLPFPEAENEFVDARVRDLVAIDAKTGLRDEEEVSRAVNQLIAMGTNAVPSLITLLKQAANREPRILHRPKVPCSFGYEVRSISQNLAVIGDRRAIPVLSLLIKYDEVGKGNTSNPILAELLNHGSDEQLRKDMESEDPNVARIANNLLIKGSSGSIHRYDVLFYFYDSYEHVERAARFCLSRELTQTDVLRYTSDIMHREVKSNSITFYPAPSQRLTITFDNCGKALVADFTGKRITREEAKRPSPPVSTNHLNSSR